MKTYKRGDKVFVRLILDEDHECPITGVYCNLPMKRLVTKRAGMLFTVRRTHRRGESFVTLAEDPHEFHWSIHWLHPDGWEHTPTQSTITL